MLLSNNIIFSCISSYNFVQQRLRCSSLLTRSWSINFSFLCNNSILRKIIKILIVLSSCVSIIKHINIFFFNDDLAEIIIVAGILWVDGISCFNLLVNICLDNFFFRYLTRHVFRLTNRNFFFVNLNRFSNNFPLLFFN